MHYTPCIPYYNPLPLNGRSGEVILCKNKVFRHNGSNWRFFPDNTPASSSQTITSYTYRRMCYRPQDGMLYVAALNGKICRVNPDTGSVEELSWTTTRTWTGVSVDRQTGLLYACVYSGSIYRVDVDAMTETDLVVSPANWAAIAVGAGDYLWACVGGSTGFVSRVHKQTGQITSMGMLPMSYWGLAYHWGKGRLFACISGGDLYELSTTPNGGQTAFGGPARAYYGITVNEYTDEIFCGIDQHTTNAGVAAQIDTKAMRSFVAGGPDQYRGLAMNTRDGHIYAITTTARLWKWNWTKL